MIGGGRSYYHINAYWNSRGIGGIFYERGHRHKGKI
jgi:coproporphyrinogen III oxidase